MKNLLLFFLLALPAAASPVATTTSTATVHGRTVTIITAPAASSPYYRMTYVTVTGGANPGTRLKAFVYSAGTTQDEDNVFCATTYAEMAAEATTLGVTIPAQVSGQP